MAYFYYGAINEENGGNWVDCLRKYKEAELLIKETGNTDLEAYIYKALSNVYYMLGANTLSDSYTNKCIALSKIDNDKEQLACLYCTKADLFRRMGLEDSGYINLDFMGNLGHSIVKQKNDRIYIEKGNKSKLDDVALFTFEPHISISGSKYGYKRENIYYFEDGRIKEL